jgi:choline dehydrogenase-like flavoprotein
MTTTRSLLQGETPPRLTTQVCIIGAGAAGAYLALALAAQGVDVMVLEAGPAQSVDPGSIDFVPQFTASLYAGATLGRAFGLGGTTSRWGGLLVSHSAFDLRAGTPEEPVWAHIVDQTRTQAAAVLARLGYRAGPDFVEAAEGLLLRSAKGLSPAPAVVLAGAGLPMTAGLHLPFRLKNFSRLLDQAKRLPRPPQVVHDATVTQWTATDTAKGTRITSVTARSPVGTALRVQADQFVIAAGGLESPRLLLELNAQHGQALFPAGSRLGQGLGDHLSLPIATAQGEDRCHAARLFGPRFNGDFLRSIRFHEAHAAPDSPRGFLHFSFEMRSAGFELARKCLQALQRRQAPRIVVSEALAGAADLGRLGWARLIDRKLYIPEEGAVSLLLDMEQTPEPANRISLGDSLDALGRRRLSVHWRVSADDQTQIAATAARLLARWDKARRALPSLPALTPVASVDSFAKLHDAYHPVGACAMGADGLAAVDLGLKAQGVQNLFVASTAVLPSAGSANPTFTLLCLTEALAQTLARQQARGLGNSRAQKYGSER